MRRWIVLLTLFCVACGRETPDTVTMPASPPRSHELGGIIPDQPRVTARRRSRSTPQKCAGDGSYGQALDCFRMAAGFTFVITDAHGVLAQGEMTRSTPGMERAWFRASGASWIGEARRSGVVWSRNGKHEQSPPEITNLVWQRTTMVLDPQKKEGAPLLAGVERLGGDTVNHYHFTNANSGETNDVWVSTLDGRIVKWTAGASTLRFASPTIGSSMIR